MLYYFSSTLKLLILGVLVLNLVSCASGRFILIDGVLIEASSRSNIEKRHMAIVSSEISDPVRKYLEETYKDSDMVAGNAKITPVKIDGKTPIEASGGKISRFTRFSDNSYYFEIQPGRHTFTVHTTSPVHEVQLVEISYNFRPGHRYFLGQISKHIRNDDYMSSLPSMWRIKFVLVDTIELKDVTQLLDGGAKLRVVGKLCSGKITLAAATC